MNQKKFNKTVQWFFNKVFEPQYHIHRMIEYTLMKGEGEQDYIYADYRYSTCYRVNENSHYFAINIFPNKNSLDFISNLLVRPFAWSELQDGNHLQKYNYSFYYINHGDFINIKIIENE